MALLYTAIPLPLTAGLLAFFLASVSEGLRFVSHTVSVSLTLVG